MAVCPNGHDSVTDDFCDACGARIAPSPVRVVGKHHAGGPRPAGGSGDTCPWCGSPSSGQFCEHCGFRVRRPFAPLNPSRPEPEPAPAVEYNPPPAPEYEPLSAVEYEPPSASRPPESLFPPLTQPESRGTAATAPPAPLSRPAPPAPPAPSSFSAGLPPVPEPPTGPKRTSFLDWFKSPEPQAAPESLPAAESLPARQPFPAAEPPVAWSGPPEPPEPPAPAAAADSYSWSAHAASPALPAPAQAPAPPVSRPAPPSAPLSGPGRDMTSAASPTAPMPRFTPTTWSVVVTSDQMYFDRMELKRAVTGSAVTFPAFSPERRFQLSGKQMRIGRRSTVRGVEPEIDLSGPPVDPGISRLHLLLLPAPDGSWAVLDPGSANGTLLNGQEIAPGDLIPLREGDRINLGAWTAITLRRE
jgi:FHA domain